jgi:hypothetical protein
MIFYAPPRIILLSMGNMLEVGQLCAQFRGPAFQKSQTTGFCNNSFSSRANVFKFPGQQGNVNTIKIKKDCGCPLVFLL